MTKDEALKIAIEALAKCKEAYLAGPNWQKVGYDILDKSQQACKEALEQPTLTYEDGFAHGYEAHRAEQTLEQPAQELVAWASTGYFELLKKTHCAMLPISDEKRSIYTIPLYTKDAQYE